MTSSLLDKVWCDVFNLTFPDRAEASEHEESNSGRAAGCRVRGISSQFRLFTVTLIFTHKIYKRCFRPFWSYCPKCSVCKICSLAFSWIKRVCVTVQPVCDCVLQEMESLRCDQSSLQREQSALTQVASVWDGNEPSPRWTWTCHFSFTETSNAQSDERPEGAWSVGETRSDF